MVGMCSIDTFDKCARDLEINGGYALLPLSELLQSSSSPNIISKAFDNARCILSDGCDDLPFIDPSTDSGSWTGYHKADVSNGRYNHHRAGFVFSNGEFFNVRSKNIEFESDMKQLFHFCHDVVANGVLRAIERRLELPDCYFDKELGPTNNASQWHLKQFRHSNEASPLSERDKKKVLLPMHTDPSLISVVIIDSPGINKGGRGLEIFHVNNCSEITGIKTKTCSDMWEEISLHGHDVATIFVGSVLSYLTKGQVFSAIKHRVVDDGDGDVNQRERMAVTLFVRPQPDAFMKTLPSKHIQHESSKPPPIFQVWNRRVAKNYMKTQKSIDELA